ncbi:MAG: WG repeat-containing protein [Clostridia bacterium]
MAGFGFINQEGKAIVYTQYGFAYDFKEGLAFIDDSGDTFYGYIDKKGNVVWNNVDKTVGSNTGAQEKLYGISLNRKYGYMDRSGKVVVEPQYEGTYTFYEGLSAVKKDNKWGLIDKSGILLCEPQFKDVGSYSEGLISVRVGLVYESKNSKTTIYREGYADKNGNVLISPQYGQAYSFKDGMAEVYLDTVGMAPETPFGRSYIDKSGNFIWNPREYKKIG